MTCPVCDLGDGFHDEELHAQRVTIPGHLVVRPDPERDPGVCPNPNCRGPYLRPGLNGCRNPKHLEAT